MSSSPHDLYQHVLGKMTLPTFSVHMAFASLLILMYTTAHSHQHHLLPPHVRSSLMPLDNGTNHAEIFFRALPKVSKEALLLKFISYKRTALPQIPRYLSPTPDLLPLFLSPPFMNFSSNCSSYRRKVWRRGMFTFYSVCLSLGCLNCKRSISSGLVGKELVPTVCTNRLIISLPLLLKDVDVLHGMVF